MFTEYSRIEVDANTSNDINSSRRSAILDSIQNYLPELNTDEFFNINSKIDKQNNNWFKPTKYDAKTKDFTKYYVNNWRSWNNYEIEPKMLHAYSEFDTDFQISEEIVKEFLNDLRSPDPQRKELRRSILKDAEELYNKYN